MPRDGSTRGSIKCKISHRCSRKLLFRRYANNDSGREPWTEKAVMGIPMKRTETAPSTEAHFSDQSRGNRGIEDFGRGFDPSERYGYPMCEVTYSGRILLSKGQFGTPEIGLKRDQSKVWLDCNQKN